jgi:preprotein translocase subunit SecF
MGCIADAERRQQEKRPIYVAKGSHNQTLTRRYWTTFTIIIVAKLIAAIVNSGSSQAT